MKVALISPPQNSLYAQPPMGLALIAAILEKTGCEVAIIDANLLDLAPEEIPPLVRDYEIIGLTAMTPTIGAATKIAHLIKQSNPKKKIILGGAHATLLPEETLTNTPAVDVIVRGEGEETIVELLHALEKDEPVSYIKGISYREHGKVINNPPAKIVTQLDSLPYLAYHLLPWQKYKPHPPHGRSSPFAALITSRGCPYHCTYCSKPVFGSTFRAQSPKRVVDEIAYYKERYGIKEIAFYDDVFTLDKKRTHALADEILKAGIKVDWTCETRVNLVDKDLLRHMKESGCYAIAYGVESASPEILETLSKGITPGQVEEAIRMTQDVGLQTIGYFMLGSPGETVETANKTVRLARKLKLDYAQFAVTTPFPGTKLYEMYLGEAKDNCVPWESFVYAGAGQEVTPVFESAELSRKDLNTMVKQAYRGFYLRPSYIWQRIKRMRSFGDFKVNVKGFFMLLDSLKPRRGKA